MCGMLTPYAAVKKEAKMATRVKPPRTGAMISGWERVLPLVTTAWKHPISVSLELAWICSFAEPSKSGRLKGKADSSPRGCPPTGTTAWAETGTSELSGQRLGMLALKVC